MLRFLSDAFTVDDVIIDALVAKHCDKCAVCGGRRTLPGPADSRIKCGCLKNYNKEYSLYAANIPKEFHTLTRDDLTSIWIEENRAAASRAAKYQNQLGKALNTGFGLYLGGESGGGKTFIASLLLKQAIQEGYTCYFILLRDLVSRAINAFRDSDIQNDVDALVTSVDFLVLDDVDKVTAAKDQELVTTVLLALLKKRKYSGKPLIVTAGCRADDLRKKLGVDLAKTLTSGLSELYYRGNANLSKMKSLEDEFFNG